MRSRIAGFTLIETAATLIIIALVAVGLVSVSTFFFDRQARTATEDRLREMRRAITGESPASNQARSGFGYLGDMGRLPAGIRDLWVKGSQPAFSFDSAKRVGAGWNGPYLDLPALEYAAGLERDGWDNVLSWSDSPVMHPLAGVLVAGRLTSLGPGLALGDPDDIVLNFFESEVESRVQGYVKDANGVFIEGAALTFNYPQNGTLASQVVYSDASGYYSASDIPIGDRSITIEPRLVLAPGTTVVSGGSSEDVRFTVKNYAAAAVSVTSLTLNYTLAPDAWFEQVRVGGNLVYNSTNPRFGNGDTVTFSPVTANGAGTNAESISIRLQSAVTDVDDIVVGVVGAGGSLVLDFRNFRNVETGGGSFVNVQGVTFQVTLRNAANDIVGVVTVQP